VGAAALLTAGSALFGMFATVAVSPAGAITDADLPTSMHGAVETQAVTVGNGALSLLVDPGTAYAYSTLDRDDYGFGTPSFTMTARGANLNLGTIAYAVLWAAPDCANNNAACVLSGGKGTPNTGLHEAKGFPAYAEALYPPPPDDDDAQSQEAVYKCVVNKDGAGSPPTGGSAEEICKQSSAVPMTAWAETNAPEYRATGFSRAAGFDVPGVLAVRGSESFSEVRPIAPGLVQSTGYSNVSGIEILGGQIRIDNVLSTSTVVSSVDGADVKKSSSSCSFAGLSVAGQGFSTDLAGLANPQLQAALDSVATSSGYRVELIAPGSVPLAQVDEGKFVSGCSGLQLKFTDLHTQAPIPLCFPSDTPEGVPSCLPALGNREEFSFGKISVQQSVTDLAGLFGGDGSGVGDGSGAGSEAVGGGDFASVGSVDSGGPAGAAAAVTDYGAGSGSASGSGSQSVSSGSKSGASSGARSGSGYEAQQLKRVFDPQKIGAATAAAGAGLVLAVLVLIGVVNALASGMPFKIPGF
jgi:hypothetical protein